jgi:hypothetical protein
LELEYLGSDIIRPLQTLTRAPQSPANQSCFEDFTPRIQIYLSNNSLRSLPSEIWSLKHLRVLSLRNNKLIELSPAIGQLSSLRELNLASNRLTWLPYEILGLLSPLGNLDQLNLTWSWPADTLKWWADNNFREVLCKLQRRFKYATVVGIDEKSDKDYVCRQFLKLVHETGDLGHNMTSEQQEFLSQICKTCTGRVYDREHDHHPLLLGTSQIHLFEADGVTRIGDDRAQMRTQAALDWIPTKFTDDIPASPISSSVPTLLELALRTAATYLEPKQIKHHLGLPLPVGVERAIEHAQTARNEGHCSETHARICSVCKRKYIIPRAEWIEYWSRGLAAESNEQYWLPLKRRVCSHRCAIEAKADHRVKLYISGQVTETH